MKELLITLFYCGDLDPSLSHTAEILRGMGVDAHVLDGAVYENQGGRLVAAPDYLNDLDALTARGVMDGLGYYFAENPRAPVKRWYCLFPLFGEMFRTAGYPTKAKALTAAAHFYHTNKSALT